MAQIGHSHFAATGPHSNVDISKAQTVELLTAVVPLYALYPRPKPYVSRLSAQQAANRINGFDRAYANDWNQWRNYLREYSPVSDPLPQELAVKFLRVMGKWQACRPKRLTDRTSLIKTLGQARNPLQRLQGSDLRSFRSPTHDEREAVGDLWAIFQDELCEGGASEVRITKALLLLTEGRIGPALDSAASCTLQVYWVPTADALIQVLSDLANDVAEFEERE